MLIGTQSPQDLATCWIMGFGSYVLQNGYCELKALWRSSQVFSETRKVAEEE